MLRRIPSKSHILVVSASDLPKSIRLLRQWVELQKTRLLFTIDADEGAWDDLTLSTAATYTYDHPYLRMV